MKIGLSPSVWIIAALVASVGAGVPQAAAARASAFAIEHVTLIDGTGRAPQPDATVVVIGDRISAVGDRSLRIPRGARRVDGRGRYLIPGLMDMHVHLLGGGAWRDSSAQSDMPVDPGVGIRTLQGFLYYGVTSVYDAGNNPDFILGLRARERAGEIVAPRVFATGQLLSYPGSWSVGYAGIGLRDWPGATQDLDLQVARRPDLQKFTYESFGVGPNPLIPSMPKELLARSIAYVKERGIRTTVHVSSEAMARDAIEAGIDTLAHVPATGVLSRGFVELLAQRRIPVQTSLAVFDEIVQLESGVGFLETTEYRAVVDPREPAARAGARERYIRLGWPAWFRVVLPFAQRNIAAIHAAGGVLVLASDRTFAPSLLREIELVVDCGIPPLDVLTIATLNGARFLGREQDLGSIEPGKLADMVLLEADPLADIRNVRRVETVWKGGAEIDRLRLDLPVNGPRSRIPAPVDRARAR
jgi:imidazolonepropionase-like amidohydrolase